MSAATRRFVCTLDDILDGGGACALLDGEQVALFRIGDEIFALENQDPFSGANVLSRGLVGDLQGQLVVASPVYKQHFNLRTGRCLEDESVALRTWNCGLLDGRIWIEPRPRKIVGHTGSGRRRLVVVGNGMAAMRTVEQLLEQAPEDYEITVFGAEPRGNYNRILLSPLLAGSVTREAIGLHDLAWYRDRGITLHVGDAVVAIDRRRRQVTAASGAIATYDRLLLATGSDPVRLGVPGQDLPGVYCFRSLDDVDGMLEQSRAARSAVVIGAGLLGLEAASGLAAQGLAVTVVHLREHVMDRQLDAEAAGLLRTTLEARGLSFRLGARTAAIEGSGKAEAVHLEGGERLAADLVVVAAGIRPRTGLARDCGLACDRGILVDDTLQTFDPAIYAVGECVQHRGTTYGLVAPLWEQSRVCAAHLAERGGPRFRGVASSAQLKVTGVEVFSAGDPSRQAGAETLHFLDRAAGIYKRVWLKGGRMQAAILYGDTRSAGWFAELIERQEDVSGLRGALLLEDRPLREASR
jgi:NAD(P)H-dependent nitrite reductase small subunit